MSTRAGSSRSARGRRSSASAGCGRCSRRSAIRSSPTPRCTSSARTASRRRRGRSRRCCSREGLSVGATVSPHVRSWAERITVDGEEADFEAALARVRPEAEAQGATQFEALTAAALAEFAAREVDAAVVEAGLGGRLDATNVLRSHVVLLTNVGLEHTDVLGETREEIAAEKLAVVQEGTVAVLPDEEFAHLAGPNVVVGGAREAAAAFLGRPRRAARSRSRCRAGSSGAGDELWDGAHNPDGAALAGRAPRALRLHGRRVDPARQGRRRDAALARPCGPAARRDRLVERPRAAGRRARAAGRAATSPRSRPCRIRPRRSPAPASTAPCS